MLTAWDHALALYDLIMSYKGLTIEQAKQRLRLSDEEFEEAREILREAYRQWEEQQRNQPVTV